MLVYLLSIINMELFNMSFQGNVEFCFKVALNAFVEVLCNTSEYQ